MARKQIEKDCDNSSFSADLEHPYRGENCHRHKQISKLSRKDKEVKVVNTVSKELSSKEFARNLSTFNPSGAFQKKQITCTSNQVEISFYSPLHGISDPGYIKKWKCEDMISEQTDSCDRSKSPSVVGVKLNWKKDVKVQQISKFSRKTRNVEAEMTTTDFDFESKMQFQRDLQTAQEELFHHERNFMVLDGNQCHGGVAMKAKELKRDDQEETPEGSNSTTRMPPTFLDQEEHIFLLVPFHSKSGFDSDIDKRYTFPYHGRFSIGKKTLEHKFDLRLALTKQPQHFGLVFTFPSEEPQSITVKSLITVYSVFPTSSRHASLVTYKSHSTENNDQKSGSSKSSRRSLVKNVSTTVSEYLTDGKLQKQGYGLENRYKIECDIVHPHRRFSEFSRNKFSLDELDNKHKAKQNLLKTMKAEAKEY